MSNIAALINAAVIEVEARMAKSPVITNPASRGGVKHAAFGYMTLSEIQLAAANELAPFSWIRGVGFAVSVYEETLSVRFDSRLTRSALADARKRIARRFPQVTIELWEPDPRTVADLVDAIDREAPAEFPDDAKKAAHMIAFAYVAFQRKDWSEAHAAYLIAADTAYEAGLEKLGDTCRASAKGCRRQLRIWRFEVASARRTRSLARVRLANQTDW